jgi:hypothetical protein
MMHAGEKGIGDWALGIEVHVEGSVNGKMMHAGERC